MTTTMRCLISVAVGLVIANSAMAEDWPQFLGPRRDNRSAETGLLKQWPEGGPKLLWRAEGLGAGYSTVAVADGMIYTTGDIAGELVIIALDLSGREVWRRTNGRSYQVSVPGSRSTPTVTGGKLYHLNAYGNLVCLDAKTGAPVWAVDTYQRFGGREITWGVAESPLVDGPNVICCPGGESVFMAALDKDTGETRWTCTGVGDQHSHASARIIEYQGLRQIVTMTAAAAIGVAPDTGRLLWRFPHPARVNCDTPEYDDGRLFLFGTWGFGATGVKLTVDGETCSAEQMWHTEDLDNEHGGVMYVDGFLYGQADGNHQHRHLACLDAQTGATKWSADDLAGQLSSVITFAEGLLYIVTDTGEVGLVRPSPERLEVVSRFHLPQEGVGPVWAFPVVCNGRLHVRHGEFLYAYDVRPSDA
jgi:outer membrane protein assembly factor BamB